MFLIMAAVVAVVAMGLQRTSGDAACTGRGSQHTVIIHNGSVSDSGVQAHRCDTLVFRNTDHVTREIGFGPHDTHMPYDGVSERFLNKGESFTVTLNTTGTYHWHDHLHDDISGLFTVER